MKSFTVVSYASGNARQVLGRDAASVARTRFGRTANVRLQHDDASRPAVLTWLVTRTNKHGTHVIGRITTLA